MKKFLINKSVKLNRLNSPVSRRFYPVLLIVLLFSGLVANAQLPVVSVRFNNPQYDCPTQTYCLDVEFQADGPNDTLFGMNVRFFYDDNILEYIGMSDFAPGYGAPAPPQIQTGPGLYWGFAGPAEWINGYMQLLAPQTTAVLPVTGWIKLFKICFHVDDPYSINIDNFCPSVVWDLQYPFEVGGGFLPGDNGVVITLVNPIPGGGESIPTTEHVVQFNWQYGGAYFGFPVPQTCISTDCWEVPLSNWSLILAIGLMVVTTLFVMRRRMNV